MGKFSIKDLEKLSGIKAHTIRIWEKRYGLIQPCRTTSNIRYYNDQELRRLLNISILVRHGFKISQIAKLSENEIGEKVLMLSQQSGKADDVIENMIVSIMEYDEENIERYLLNHILKYGLEETFIKLIIPLQNRLDILLQTNTLSIPQVKFAYYLIRQRLIVAIDSQREKYNPSADRPLVFIFEPEKNEIWPLFLQYILRKNGFPSLYLGRVASFSDLEKLIEQKTFHRIITSLSLPIITESFQNFLVKLAQLTTADIYLFLIHSIDYSDFSFPSNIRVIDSFSNYSLLIGNVQTVQAT
ncbi:MAG: MerR family transcriptional regulator [Bacteroidales bacterium]|nr:MerR family transcriptional regulator [Bacteroidales bacterium]HOK97882.1 MerR family transcriptional regulator [Bacteroidales bacterium]HPO64647.1 MerR family transcriptional regulator [Bacteroidales bacterium]